MTELPRQLIDRRAFDSQVYWTFPRISCPHCGSDAARVWDTTRAAIDIDLDQPVILAVRAYTSAQPQPMFRAQPSFLRPHAGYTRRVVQNATDPVYRDGLATRCCARSPGARFLDQAG
jgi:hypothetical protein